MKIDIITIFPEFFDTFLATSIVKRAIEKGYVSIQTHDLRAYSQDKHKKVDDTPYGGGVGMLMTFPPFYECLQDLKKEDSYVVYLSPQGQHFKQDLATSWAQEKKHIILLCGHYEGIDARIEAFIDCELSVGDYVLTGGELPAMIVADVLTRLIPGVIAESSVLEDSLQQGLLKYPQYTKPESYKGYDVPKVLVSGHHENIRKWRLEEQLRKTAVKRPDLLKDRQMTQEEQKIVDKLSKTLHNI